MVAIIASNKKLKSKLANRGYMGLYLGRVRDHTVDTYRFYNMATRSVLLSRSVKFTNLMYSEYIPQTIPVNPYSVLYTDDDDDDEPSFAPTATPSTTNIPWFPTHLLIPLILISKFHPSRTPIYLLTIFRPSNPWTTNPWTLLSIRHSKHPILTRLIIWMILILDYYLLRLLNPLVAHPPVWNGNSVNLMVI